MTPQLPPSRRDILGPPPRDVTDLGKIVRHHGSYLRSLEPGVDGRFKTPRPVPSVPSQLVGDGGGDGDSPDYLWEFNDRLVVTTAGAQSFRLTYEPDEESLFVYWHPDGKAPIKQVNEHWSLDGQIVTILDPDGDIQPGDMFSAQYRYEPTEVVDTGLVLVGTGTAYASNPTLALPAGTQVGDFIVITTITGTISDARVSPLANHDGSGVAHFYHYAGTITSLDDFAAAGGTTLATWAVFRAPEAAATPAAQAGPGSSLAGTTTVSNAHAIIAVSLRASPTDASLTIPAGYTLAVQNALLVHARSAIAYWDATAGESSPSGPIAGTFDDYLINILGVTNDLADN